MLNCTQCAHSLRFQEIPPQNQTQHFQRISVNSLLCASRLILLRYSFWKFNCFIFIILKESTCFWTSPNKIHQNCWKGFKFAKIDWKKPKMERNGKCGAYFNCWKGKFWGRGRGGVFFISIFHFNVWHLVTSSMSHGTLLELTRWSLQREVQQKLPQNHSLRYYYLISF